MNEPTDEVVASAEAAKQKLLDAIDEYVNIMINLGAEVQEEEKTLTVSWFKLKGSEEKWPYPVVEE